MLSLNLDGQNKRLSAIEQLISKEGKLVTSLIFEDESYVFFDKDKRLIEYGPAANSYLDASETYRRLETEERQFCIG
ncbi:MAG: hypothetical protein IC227_09755 [Enterococcus lacertideformus]|uniref:Uncharacterized protein n=1 Tax=Enterococcus lacertideformus TaxID=2771493 RepID=A0A931B181_9ENTE|nr:hypothetical protein [Enterococcus lacertideformus]